MLAGIKMVDMIASTAETTIAEFLLRPSKFASLKSKAKIKMKIKTLVSAIKSFSGESQNLTNRF